MELRLKCLHHVIYRRTLWTSVYCLQRDYYGVLGLSKTCSQKEIRDKYVELCKLYHPDTATDEKQKELKKLKFQEINEAYTQLSKTNSRKDYDEGKTHTPGYNPYRGYRNPYGQTRDTDTGGWSYSWREAYSQQDPFRRTDDSDHFRRRREYEEFLYRQYANPRKDPRNDAEKRSHSMIVSFCVTLIILSFMFEVFTHIDFDPSYEDPQERRKRMFMEQWANDRRKVNPEDMRDTEDFKKRLEESQIKY